MDLWENRDWTPMLLDERDKPFDSDNFLYEVKFDGIRAIIYVSPDEFEIRNRHNVSMTHLYPELKEIQKLVKKKTILDGEIVAMDNGVPSFSKLQKRSHLKSDSKINMLSKSDPVVFVGFDILYQDKNLIDKKLIERKKILDKLQENDVFIKSRVIENTGIKLFKRIVKLNLEGIVAKEKNSMYEINRRVKTWIKIKNFMTGEFLIGGYTLKKGNRVSLSLGEYWDGKFCYVGNSSIMMNNPIYSKIIGQRKLKTSPFVDYDDKSSIHVEPLEECTITYMERTSSNHLRQPVIKSYFPRGK